jgi:metal-responsive CopG/Arc/MetJ family transcriptional regulator
MKILTSIPDALVNELERLSKFSLHQTRSEMVREAVRAYADTLQAKYGMPGKVNDS